MNTYEIQLNDRQLNDLKMLLELGREGRADWSKHHYYECQQELDNDNRLVGEGYKGILEVIEERSVMWCTSCGLLDLIIPMKVVESIAVSGDNEPAVLDYLSKPTYLRRQLEEMDSATAADHLAEHGLEQFAEGGASRNDKAEIMKYMLWTACHDVNEEVEADD